jgi:hypothetical protein
VGNLHREMEADHEARLINMALSLISTVDAFNTFLENSNGFTVKLKIGIHTDSIVCSVFSF